MHLQPFKRGCDSWDAESIGQQGNNNGIINRRCVARTMLGPGGWAVRIGEGGRGRGTAKRRERERERGGRGPALFQAAKLTRTEYRVEKLCAVYLDPTSHPHRLGPMVSVSVRARARARAWPASWSARPKAVTRGEPRGGRVRWVGSRFEHFLASTFSRRSYNCFTACPRQPIPGGLLQFPIPCL